MLLTRILPAALPCGLAVALLLGLAPGQAAGVQFRRPRGCSVCEGAGYRGRLGLFERLELDSDLRDRVFRQESLESIRAAALASGKLRLLHEDGAEKVMAGVTSVTEVLRVTRTGGDSA